MTRGGAERLPCFCVIHLPLLAPRASALLSLTLVGQSEYW